uniref:Peptidase S1 domain-containing protein n=1 Tax=Strigamia maritima TaxID=126957 RepID=T1JML1_STRMM
MVKFACMYQIYIVCGKRIFAENSTLSHRKVGPAAWPWHVSIIKNDAHVCDGTLIADQWVLTSDACFQGQPESDWKIRVGTSRLLTLSPNEQQRQVLSVSRSPAEGTTLSLLHLKSPVNFSSTVRPACITSKNQSYQQCIVLSWDLKGEQLYEKAVRIVNTEECGFWDIMSPNVLCIVPTQTENTCEGEDLPGSGLLCKNGNTWELMGVLNWRVSCGFARRPLLYDQFMV